jgi:hypothetical protein
VAFSEPRILVELGLYRRILLGLSFCGRKGVIAITNSLYTNVSLSFHYNDFDIGLYLATLCGCRLRGRVGVSRE